MISWCLTDPVQVAPAALPLVPLAMAKDHLKIEYDEEDANISRLCAAAEAHLVGPSGVLGNCLGLVERWRQDYPWFEWQMELPLAPVRAIFAVQYYDLAGTQQTLASSVYALKHVAGAGWLYLVDGQAWPTVGRVRPDAVSVTFDAGYVEGARELEQIRWCALALVAHWFKTREPVIVGTTATEVPMNFDAMLYPIRRKVL